MKQIMAVLTRTADAAMLTDESGKVVLWNKAAERLLGFKAEEVMGRPCHEVLRGQTLDGRPLCSPTCPIGHRIACGGGVRNFDVQTYTKTGRTLCLNVSSLPVPSRRKDRFVTAHLFRDISKQAKARQLLNELQSVLSAPPSPPGVDLHPVRSLQDQHDQLPQVPSTLPLTNREREVLSQLASGKNTKSIADTLCISPATVRNHIKHIFEKLGAHNRLQALAIAFRPGTPFPPRNL